MNTDFYDNGGNQELIAGRNIYFASQQLYDEFCNGPYTDCSYVYLINTGKFIKIGHTTNLKDRTRRLRGETSPEIKLTIISLIAFHVPDKELYKSSSQSELFEIYFKNKFEKFAHVYPEQKNHRHMPTEFFYPENELLEFVQLINSPNGGLIETKNGELNKINESSIKIQEEWDKFKNFWTPQTLKAYFY